MIVTDKFSKTQILNHFKITEHDLVKVIVEALKTGADYADLYFEHKFSNNIRLMDGAVNSVNANIDYGVGVRVIAGDQTGYAYVESSDINDLIKAAQTASTIAHQASKNVAISVNETHFRNHYPIKHEWLDVSVSDKKKYVEKLNEQIFALDQRVVKASVSFRDATSYVLFFNSEGVLTWDYRPTCMMLASCTMEDNGKLESGSTSKAYRKGFEFLSDELVSNIATELIAHTSIMFEAIKPKGGEMPVVMGAGGSGILLHEAIGHAFEADFNRKNTSIFSDQLGQKICSDKINVVDDGTIDHMYGSINFDDEGVSSQKTYIVKDGVLESYLHDRISAKFYNVAPTGNGRRQSFRYPPVPRMRVTYMEDGDIDEKDIIASVKNGIYVDNFSNGQVQIGAGDFTFYVKTGYLIENGKLTYPLKDINIIGNGPKALADISMVGNNLKIDDSAWSCGKDGQSVPVGQGLPTVLVDRLTVGGEY